MKAYVCDSCGKTILDPFAVKMRKFYIGSYYTLGMVCPENSKEEVEGHLCKNCYEGLYSIADRSDTND